MGRFVAVLGPGLVVMLADTDVGSIITAGQSGVQWGYRLLLLQLVLIPILYMVQELTVRLGIFTGRGHGELIKETFGKAWAWISVAGLGGRHRRRAAHRTLRCRRAWARSTACPGRSASASRAATLLLIVLTGSYRRVERAAIASGCSNWPSSASPGRPIRTSAQMATQAVQIPVANKDYLYLVAANIGAVIMPWMVFYQQSAVADKRLKPEHFNAARMDTALGAVLTQLVMAAVLVAAAATLSGRASGETLKTVGDLSAALTPFLGVGVGRLVFGLGIIGAGHGGRHRRLPGPGLGPRRGDRLQAVAGVSSAGGAVVLPRLCGQHRRRLRPRRRLAGPGLAQRRRAGDERPAAAGGAGLPDRPGGEGAAGERSASRAGTCGW